MKTVLILGATSAIAIATARLWAEKRYTFILIGRNQSRLDAVQKDLIARGAVNVKTAVCDVTPTEEFTTLFSKLLSDETQIDIFFIASGMLPSQEACETYPEPLSYNIDVNAKSSLIALNLVSQFMVKQNYGQILVITSVAGDRGRKSNFAYGAAKKMVSVFVEGLAHKFHKTPINVIDIKPGLVNSPMTQHIDKKGALWSSPEKIAGIIVKHEASQSRTVYAPPFWFFIMLVIRSMPSIIFRRTEL